jgi:hypothetical protein
MASDQTSDAVSMVLIFEVMASAADGVSVADLDCSRHEDISMV